MNERDLSLHALCVSLRAVRNHKTEAFYKTSMDQLAGEDAASRGQVRRQLEQVVRLLQFSSTGRLARPEPEQQRLPLTDRQKEARALLARLAHDYADELAYKYPRSSLVPGAFDMRIVTPHGDRMTLWGTATGRSSTLFKTPDPWHNVTWDTESQSNPFGKRVRNKFNGIDRPVQVVNSNRFTKKKAKRK